MTDEEENIIAPGVAEEDETQQKKQYWISDADGNDLGTFYGTMAEAILSFPDGSSISDQAPPVYAYATAAEAKLAMVNWIDDFIRGITGQVPEHEKLAWATKEAAARAVNAGNADANQTAMLTAEALATGETIEELATKIIGRADLYRQVISLTSGLRRRTDKLLDEATDPAIYQTILEQSITLAQSEASKLGL